MGATADARLTEREKRAEARINGFEDEPCSQCGNRTVIIRQGTCRTCGAESFQIVPVELVRMPLSAAVQRRLAQLSRGVYFFPRWR